MRILYFAFFILFLNTSIVRCAKNSTESDEDEKRVPSVEFKSENSEIQFGQSVSEEFKSKSSDSTADDAYYDEYEDSEDGNEVSSHSEKQVTKEISTREPFKTPSEVADTETKGVPTEVFLTMRNLTEESENFRTFKKRNDENDLQASASDNLPVNGTGTEAAVDSSGWNSRAYRDTRYPPEFGELPLQHVQLPYQHAKIDTADLSDCALQGEWKPIGEIKIDANQEDLQQEHDYLIPAGSHNAHQNGFGVQGSGFAAGDHDSYSSFQNYYIHRPVQNSFAEFQKLTADAASAQSGHSGFDLNQHLQKYVAGSVSPYRGADLDGISSSHGLDGGFNDLYKHTAGNVLSYNQQSSEFGNGLLSHGHAGYAASGDHHSFGGSGGGGGTGNKFYHGQGIGLGYGLPASGGHHKLKGHGPFGSGPHGSGPFGSGSHGSGSHGSGSFGSGSHGSGSFGSGSHGSGSHGSGSFGSGSFGSDLHGSGSFGTVSHGFGSFGSGSSGSLGSGHFGPGAYLKLKPNGGANHYGRYPPNGFQSHRKPGAGGVGAGGLLSGEIIKPKDPYLTLPSKPQFFRGKKPGNAWKIQKFKTRDNFRRPNFEGVGSFIKPSGFPSGLSGPHAEGSFTKGYGGGLDSSGVVSGVITGHKEAEDGISISDNHLLSGHAESLALASTAGNGFLTDSTNQHLVGQNVGQITHEAILQDASQLTSFTCGKNHDHGTNYHTASFQVSDDDHGSQDVLQYQDGAHVIIHASNNGFEDVLHAERKHLDEDADSSAAASKESTVEIITGNAKGASNHRYTQSGTHEEGGHNDENSGTSDQIEEPTSHNYFRDGSQGPKFPSTDNSPIQFGFSHYDKSSHSESSSETPKIVRELQDLSNRFQLELDKSAFANAPAQAVSYETFFTDSEGSKAFGGEKFKESPRSPVIHNGYSVVNVNNFEISPNEERYRFEEYHQNEGDIITEYPHYVHHSQDFESSGGKGPEDESNYHSLPVVITEHHPGSKEDKPKVHTPPKRKHHGKQYEVHENSGEKQRPSTEIFPPQKFPRQFHNPMPNFAGGRPPAPKHQRLVLDGLPPYGAIPLRAPLPFKKIKKYKPVPVGKVKFRRPVLVRRPVTESVRITTAPVVRVSVSS